MDVYLLTTCVTVQSVQSRQSEGLFPSDGRIQRHAVQTVSLPLHRRITIASSKLGLMWLLEQLGAAQLYGTAT